MTSDLLGCVQRQLATIRDRGLCADPVYRTRMSRPPVPADEISHVEREHGVRLPSGYRDFLTTCGLPEFSPGQELFLPTDRHPLVPSDGGHDVIDLTAEFPFTDAWDDDEVYNAVEEQAPDLDDRLERYFSTSWVRGSMPLLDLGCGDLLLLVLNGPERGTVWFDGRANWSGIFPLTLSRQSQNSAPEQPRLTFLEFYSAWLGEVINGVPRVEQFI
ncbi:MAG: SMI1/KNR4 family protein [Arachnia propionica]|uniref:SMI1/KNR4 family protein n=1 Tax=Arachnia propionica TaxID=1750 RepID=UPI00270910D2|nr:SMI1/KNR4 family protein [Arachnia propionica]